MATPDRRKIVKLLNPSLCAGCRFADSTVIATEGHAPRRMLMCKRLDCDNWDTTVAYLDPEKPDDSKP